MSNFFFGETLQVKEPTNNYGPLPIGLYTVSIESAEGFARNTNDGRTQEGINIKFIVVDGEYKGRYLFEALTFTGTTERATQYATSRVIALAWACGLNQIKSSGELVGNIVDLSVTIEKRDGYEPRNRISKYLKHEDIVAKQQSSSDDDVPQDDSLDNLW